MGLLGIERCINSGIEKDYSRNAVVIVPSIVIQSQWETLLGKFRMDEFVDVYVVNTATKKVQKGELPSYDILVLDEVHRFASNQFKRCFEVPHSFRLGLTASLERSDNRHKLIQKKAPVVDEITVNEALENEWISDFTIYNYGVGLAPEDQEALDDYTAKFKHYFKAFQWDFDLAMSCTNPANAKKYAKEINHPDWTADRIQICAVQFGLNMRKRKELLYNTKSKLDAGLEILEHEEFKDRKLITFSQATDMADSLTEAVNERESKQIAASYHSNLPTITVKGKKKGAVKRRKKNLKSFNDGRTNVKIINTAKALDEGFDVGDLDRAIILSGTSEPRQFIQRIGRTLRKREGKHSVIICVYIKNSQDEKWLRKAQESIRPDKIKEIESLDEIGEEFVESESIIG